MSEHRPKPATISVPAAGQLLDIGRSSAYRAARLEQLPILPVGKTGKRVVLIRLEEMVGRPFSRQELIEAGAMHE
jgi:hypothetical protein